MVVTLPFDFHIPDPIDSAVLCGGRVCELCEGEDAERDVGSFDEEDGFECGGVAGEEGVGVEEWTAGGTAAVGHALLVCWGQEGSEEVMLRRIWAEWDSACPDREGDLRSGHKVHRPMARFLRRSEVVAFGFDEGRGEPSV